VRKFLIVLTLLLVSLFAVDANAQYFGRNKVQWEHFDFKVLQTEHFDIYYYDREADVVNDIGRMAERWYARLSKTFNHTFGKKPIVLYANAADFQQTTTTPEIIGQGTGGFTDPFMNRVVLPLTGDYAENDHVLGHEMVHVFQFDIAASMTNNRSRFRLEQMPLWLVEGMAEYFSKGRIDPLTAMWIRDATIHNRLPDIKRLTRDPRYFPYRYGQAFLAYMGARFGDETVVRYFMSAGQVGVEESVERATGVPARQLFADWAESARELYTPVIEDRPTALGAPLLGRKTTRGDLNLAPALSPDGKYVAFLSTRELFTIDLFLADAHTGQILRRLVSSDRDQHFDSISFVESAGVWSPDSKRLAFVVFAKGDNYIGLIDAEKGRVENVRVPGLDAINTLSWSPDGHTIALSGQKTGVTDLFLYDLETKNVRQLTNDKYADLQPAFSPDGHTIAFVTDRGANTDMDKLSYSDMRIATVDISTGAVHELPLFDRAKHINPQWAPDGNSIYFIANPEGVPDVYRYSLAENRIQRITHVQTGVAGITDLSPALSVASHSGDIAFSLYEDDDYNIYTLPADASGQVITTTVAPGVPRAAVLPPARSQGSEITTYLSNPQEGLLPANSVFRTRNYSPGLHIAYIGPPTVGVATGSYGTGVGGSVSAYYTDILGEHNVGFTIEGGGTQGIGTIGDQIAGEFLYLNQQHRWNWGADLTHLPYISAFTNSGTTVVDNGGQQQTVDFIQQTRQIVRFDDLSGIFQYPFSTTRRVEAQVGFQHYGVKNEVETLLVDPNTGGILSDTTQSPGGNLSLNLPHVSAALVGDTSIFGFISPLMGSRYRFEGGVLSGDLHFETALADVRKYWYSRPLTFAVRGIHYGRYGADAEDPRLTPLYIGDSYLIRGYDINSIGLSECKAPAGSMACPVFDRLIGSKIAVVNAEVRLPLFGNQQFGIASGFIPTELVAFIDGGTAWSKGQSPKLAFKTTSQDLIPVFSAGISARMLLSYIPLEFYWAKPFQRPDAGWQFGFNIIPGW
jgi:Omp85 superfamily domain/WD40-like Beta Propeller Repeat